MKNRQHSSQGFTLVELMIVVAIIAILASIIYPNYIESVRKSRRAAAASCMMQANAFMERYYTTNMTYLGATLPALGCITEVAQFHTVGLSGTPTATAFTLQAVPSTGGDPKCGTLTLNEKGTKTKSGTASSVANCF